MGRFSQPNSFTTQHFKLVRGQSLITGRGAPKQAEKSSFTPPDRGGGEVKVLAVLKGGGLTSFEVVVTWVLEVLAML